MPAKPNENTILATYSLDELIDLAKEKARMDMQEQLDNARNHLNALSQAVAGELLSSQTKRSMGTGRRGRPKSTGTGKVGRPKGITARSTEPKTTRKRASNKMSLGSYLQEILNSTPMKIDDIIGELDKRGYKSKSKDPRRVLYLELKKQIEKGNAQKLERGTYVKA